MNSLNLIVILLLINFAYCIDFIPPTSSSFEKCYQDIPDANNGQLSDSPSDYSRALISGLHKFSIDVLKSLHNFESKDTSFGLILSPFSIWSALIVSYMGAQHETEKELKSVLGLNNVPKYSIGMAYQGLRFWYLLKKNISSNTKDFSKKSAYSIANKIFINDKLIINQCIKQHFTTEIQPIDFTNNPNKARKQINNWVENQTNGKIKDLLTEGTINQWTSIIIANAIYFHNKWYNQFDQTKNEIGPFYVTPTETIKVTYMKQTANLMYGISEKLKATIIELPYTNQDFSMLIILPDTSRGIDNLVKLLKPSHIDEILQNMYDDEVTVLLPKFKSEQELDLAGPLYSLGIKKLFDPRYVDLSGFFNTSKLSSNNFSVKGITVNSVIHKTFISVNEEGTEAAAATAMLIARSGRPAFPTRFVVNRPFMFLIRDTATNILLFVGIVRRPYD